MDNALLQDWTTIKAGAGVDITQDDSVWLDVENYQDAIFWIDCKSCSGTPTLFLETAPQVDGPAFLPTAVPLVLSTSSAVVVPTVRSLTTAPLAKWLRWRVVSTSGAWDATFRVRIGALRQRLFSPLGVPGCIVWTRADLGIALSGASVQTWRDQSGNGRDFVGAAGTQPLYNGVGVSGLPSVQFNGTSQYMNTASFSFPAEVSIFSVVRPSVSPQPGGCRIIENGYPTGFYFGTDVGAGSAWELILSNKFGSAIGGSVVTGATQLVSAVYSATTGIGTVFQNGVAVGSDTFTAPAVASHALYLSRSATVSGWYFSGDMSEILLYGRAVQASERTQITRYLGGRYGVAVP